MKKISYLFMFVAIATLGIFSSCNPVTDIELKVTHDNKNGTVASDTIVFDKNAKTTGKDVTFKLDITATDSEIALITVKEATLKIDTTLAVTATSFKVNIPEPKDDKVVKYSFEFYVENDAKTPASEKVTKAMAAQLIPLAYPVVKTYTNVLLQSQTSATKTGLHNTLNNTKSAWGTPDVKADIAFLRTGNAKVLEYVMVSPNATLVKNQLDANFSNTYSTAAMQETKFVKVTVADWTAVNDEFLNNWTLPSGSTWSDRAKDVNVGEYYAFLTKDNRKGIIKIVTTGGTSYAGSELTYDVKVQETGSAGK